MISYPLNFKFCWSLCYIIVYSLESFFLLASQGFIQISFSSRMKMSSCSQHIFSEYFQLSTVPTKMDRPQCLAPDIILGCDCPAHSSLMSERNCFSSYLAVQGWIDLMFRHQNDSLVELCCLLHFVHSMAVYGGCRCTKCIHTPNFKMKICVDDYEIFVSNSDRGEVISILKYIGGIQTLYLS